MAYAWNWFGLANLLASALLLTLGLLFLKAKRSEFTSAFSVYCVLAAGQKLTGGVALYLAADEPTREAWLLASTIFLLASTPTLAHALTAFTWAAALRRRGILARVAFYVPFALLVPAVLLATDAFDRLALAFAIAFMTLLAIFVVPVTRRATSPTPSALRTHSRFMLAYLAIALGFSLEARVLLLLYGRMPWWELSVAYMAATGILLYGLLRTHIFDVDLKLKFALRQSTLAAIFVAIFFVVSEMAQTVLSAAVGTVLGILAAGLLIFAIHPMQRVAERIADRAMPHVQPNAEYLSYRRLEVYRSALELAAEDGVITARERGVLQGLQRNLGITEAVAEALERDVLQSTPQVQA